MSAPSNPVIVLCAFLSNGLLVGLFSEEAVFPAAPFNDGAWLPLLTDVGLRCKIDKDVFLACVLKVQSLSRPAAAHP